MNCGLMDILYQQLEKFHRRHQNITLKTRDDDSYATLKTQHLSRQDLCVKENKKMKAVVFVDVQNDFVKNWTTMINVVKCEIDM